MGRKNLACYTIVFLVLVIMRISAHEDHTDHHKHDEHDHHHHNHHDHSHDNHNHHDHEIRREKVSESNLYTIENLFASHMNSSDINIRLMIYLCRLTKAHLFLKRFDEFMKPLPQIV